jgi:hypothetical protein
VRSPRAWVTNGQVSFLSTIPDDSHIGSLQSQGRDSSPLQLHPTNNVNNSQTTHHRYIQPHEIAFNIIICNIIHVATQELRKMETITIPSPSAFLSSPVIKPAPKPPPPPPPKRKPTATTKSTNTTKKQNGVIKPKQSKSRNGMSARSGVVLS